MCILLATTETQKLLKLHITSPPYISLENVKEGKKISNFKISNYIVICRGAEPNSITSIVKSLKDQCILYLYLITATQWQECISY